jgi:predicted DNA-binding transcriptional regulator AlpA
MKKGEVAEYLSISERTVDKLTKSAILPPATVLGDHLKRWDKLKLDQHLDRKASPASSDGNSVADLLNAYTSKQNQGKT